MYKGFIIRHNDLKVHTMVSKKESELDKYKPASNRKGSETIRKIVEGNEKPINKITY